MMGHVYHFTFDLFSFLNKLIMKKMFQAFPETGKLFSVFVKGAQAAVTRNINCPAATHIILSIKIIPDMQH